jgi:hypothetical protein
MVFESAITKKISLEKLLVCGRLKGRLGRNFVFDTAFVKIIGSGKNKGLYRTSLGHISDLQRMSGHRKS